jgi:hypothetical protein
MTFIELADTQVATTVFGADIVVTATAAVSGPWPAIPYVAIWML